MTTSNEQALKQLRAEAAEAASANSPLHVIDTAVLGVLVGIGWFFGRAWWLLAYGAVFASKGLVLYVLAVRHGYRKGTKKPLKDAAQGAVPPVPQGQPQRLMADDRIMETHQTPFGVPFGPNVQAYSEPA